jgi:hypothetical protein
MSRRKSKDRSLVRQQQPPHDGRPDWVVVVIELIHGWVRVSESLAPRLPSIIVAFGITLAVCAATLSGQPLPVHLISLLLRLFGG